LPVGGVAPWIFAPGGKDPRAATAYLPQLSYNTRRPDPTRSDPSTGPTFSDPTEPNAK